MSRYRPLDQPAPPSPYPPGVSPINLLYPGKPMRSSYPYNRYGIRTEDYASLRRSFVENRNRTSKYAKMLEDLSRREGGGDENKVFPLPAVAPEATIQDPDLKFATIGDAPSVGNYYRPPTVR